MQRITFLVLLIGFLIGQQAWGQISVRGKLSDDRYVTPGTTYQGRVMVQNESDDPQEVVLYLVDYTFQSDLVTQFDDPDSHARSNAGWISLNPPRFTLPAGEIREVGYEVTVPESVEGEILEGSFWSVVMVEAVPPGSARSSRKTRKQEAAFAVRHVMRYAVQVATHLIDSGDTDLAFVEVDLAESQEGGYVLQTHLENTGDVMIRPEFYVELYDVAGNLLDRFNGDPSRMYPGTSVRQQVVLEGLRPGTYEALIVVDAGEEHIFGAQYTLQLASE